MIPPAVGILVAIVLTAGMAGAAAPPADAASVLLESGQVEQLRLWMNPGDWRALKQNYEGNKYYPAEMEWRGRRVENIGVRSRGKGSRRPQKPGLRLDFNRYEDRQEFLGLKSLALDNLAQDPPMLREYLAMRLIRHAGYPAPREAFARLAVNHEDLGLYLVVESVDKRFLERWKGPEFWDDDGGELYEYKWLEPDSFDYRGPDPAQYVPYPFMPQTHELSPRPQPLVEFFGALAEATAATVEEALANRLDWDAFLRYLALETWVAESDGLLGDRGTNNFYLYRSSNGGRFRFLPWDRDASCNQYERGVFYNAERNRLTRLALNAPALRARYVERLREVAGLAGSDGGWWEQEMAEAWERIRPYALADPVKELDNASLEQSVEDLRFFVRERPRVVCQEIGCQ
jgi:spore coat protein CotH